jgi:hypothetical protein
MEVPVSLSRPSQTLIGALFATDRGPKPPILVTKEAKDRLAGAGVSAQGKCAKRSERTLRCCDTDV